MTGRPLQKDPVDRGKLGHRRTKRSIKPSDDSRSCSARRRRAMLECKTVLSTRDARKAMELDNRSEIPLSVAGTYMHVASADQN